MSKYLNTPENIEAGFLAVDKRIRLIEQAIGYDNISELSKGIAELLFHMQIEEPSINSILRPNEKQSHIAICILNASCEIQTAYHILTIGNVPGVFRQCRLIHEYIAVVIFLSVPRKVILNELSPKKHKLINKLTQNTNSDFWDLYKSSFKSMGKNVQRIDPVIKGSLLLPPYLDFLRKCIQLDQAELNCLSNQVKHVLHPTSHGSIEMLPFHFGTAAEDGKGGINYSPNKVSMYKEGLSYLIWTVNFLVQVLDLTRSFILKSNET